MEYAQLSARLDALETRIEHAEDLAQIAGVMNRYAQCFQHGDADAITACFALSLSDVCVEFGEQKALGAEAVRYFYAGRPRIARMAGTLVQHEMAAPAIAVAEDRRTARATAFAPGFKGLAAADSQVTLLGKYYMDLTRAEGTWKIWHLQWILTAEADMAYGWLFQNRSYYKECDFPPLDERPAPQGPWAASDACIDYYKPDERTNLLPEPPQPYAHWDGYAAARDTRGY